MLATNPSVLIVILNWNGKEDTIECLESLNRLDYSGCSVVVVDNGSVDESVDSLRERFPDIVVVENGRNLGYCGGNNVGIRHALRIASDYVLILNNDTVADTDMLKELVKAAEMNNSIGIAGPTVRDYFQDNIIQATGSRICWKKGSFVKVKPGTSENNKNGPFEDADIVSGSCILAKTEAIRKVGLLDEDYFAHWEEIDWCIRFKKAGYRVVWVQSAKVRHKGGASSSKIGGFREYQNSRNRLWFMRKQAGTADLVIFFCYFLMFDFWFHALANLRYSGRRGFEAFLRGTIDGIGAISDNGYRIASEISTTTTRHQRRN